MIERKQAEEAPRQSVECFRDLLENANDLIQSVAPDGHFVLTNKAWRKVLGYSEEEVAHLTLWDIIHPDYMAHCREVFQKVMSGETVSNVEAVFVVKDGSLVTVEGNVSCRFEKGKPVSTRGIFRDITERKRAVEALRVSEERYRSLANNIKSGIFRSTPEPCERFIEVNRAMEEITGYSREELLKMDVCKLYAQPEERGAILEQIALATGKATMELRLKKKDGTEIVASDTKVAVRDDTGKILYFDGIIEDVTEHKHLEENRKFYIAEIIKAQEKERRRIARDLHDETAQSLLALSLELQAITRARDKLPEEALTRLEELCSKTNTILEGVRRFSHELRPDILDRLGLVPALELLTTELRREKVDARVEVFGAERRLESEVELTLFRTAQEALSNVRKHSQATEAVMKVRFMSKKAKLTITDNGNGFEMPDVLGDFITKGKLGVIGMRERVLLLNGAFSIMSRVGRGTKLVVEVQTKA